MKSVHSISVHSISHYLQCRYSHLGFGGSLGHVQGAAASAERGGGSKGSGRADQEGGNNELHLGTMYGSNLFYLQKVRIDDEFGSGK